MIGEFKIQNAMLRVPYRNPGNILNVNICRYEQAHTNTNKIYAGVNRQVLVFH